MDPITSPSITALGISLLAGAISFLSPCVAPLVPGYLAFITPNVRNEDESTATTNTLRRALIFFLGFCTVFVALGATSAALAGWLQQWEDVIALVGGAAMALLGLMLLFNQKSPLALLDRSSSRVTRSLQAPATAIGTFLVGAAFAVVWSPCIGPVLASILVLASGSGDAAWGALLLGVYSLGLGIPFIAAAIAIDRVGAVSRALRRHGRLVQIVTGSILLIVGVMMATGEFGRITSLLARHTPSWLS